MIDTDKYENYLFLKSQREKLNQDAPLLLEEVKRLREIIDNRESTIKLYANLVGEIGDLIYENHNSYELTRDEFNEMLKELTE